MSGELASICWGVNAPGVTAAREGGGDRRLGPAHTAFIITVGGRFPRVDTSAFTTCVFARGSWALQSLPVGTHLSEAEALITPRKSTFYTRSVAPAGGGGGLPPTVGLPSRVPGPAPASAGPQAGAAPRGAWAQGSPCALGHPQALLLPVMSPPCSQCPGSLPPPACSTAGPSWGGLHSPRADLDGETDPQREPPRAQQSCGLCPVGGEPSSTPAGPGQVICLKSSGTRLGEWGLQERRQFAGAGGSLNGVTLRPLPGAG